MRKNGISVLGALVAGIAWVGMPGPAHAVIVSAVSSPIAIQDTVTTATTGLLGDLVGKVTLGSFTFGAGTFSMSVTIANLTSAALVPSGRLTAFGFNTTPDAAGVSDDSAMFTAFFSSTFPSVGTVDICASTGPTCAGGGGGDLAPGASNTFTLTLNGLPAGTTSIDLGAATAGAAELFDFKWQTASGSFESQCTFGTTCGGGDTRGGGGDVPEPASMTLLGFGLLALGAVARRRFGG